MKNTIYAFYDPRYDQGIKVGRGNLMSCLSDAQSYGPNGINCTAFWPQETREGTIEAEKIAHTTLEKNGINRLRLPDAEQPKNGTEWFDGTATEVTSVLDDLLGKHQRPPTLKSLRKDILLSPAKKEGRLVIWVYQEELTGRLKISACSEFKSPLETRRRYSRNGFSQVAAFISTGPLSLQSNLSLDQVRQSASKHFGYGERSLKYGWLSESVSVYDLTEFILKFDHIEQLTDLKQRPIGVRPSYTGKHTRVPEGEVNKFDDAWWR